MLYTAVYENVTAALDDLEALENCTRMNSSGYDAAVIDHENGTPHIAKRVDRPRIRAIPEMFGGGTLPRRELMEAAQELISDRAGLIVVGEPTLKGIRQGDYSHCPNREALGGRYDRRACQRTSRSSQA